LGSNRQYYSIRLKIINDSLGHQIGDHLLIELSRRLEACIRPVDTVARLGGDEFAILLDRIKTVTDVLTVVHRIRQSLQTPFRLSGHDVFTTVSIGISLGTTGYERPGDALRDADTAMYRAKANGRARYELFDHSMHTNALERLQLEADLRQSPKNRHE
jgi:diguanylate cyclase (GGDEF)-like protein